MRVGCPREPDAMPLHPRRSLARTSSAEIACPRFDFIVGPGQGVDAGALFRIQVVTVGDDGQIELGPFWNKVPPSFKNPTKPGIVTVPHPKKDIPRGMLATIEGQSGVQLR